MFRPRPSSARTPLDPLASLAMSSAPAPVPALVPTPSVHMPLLAPIPSRRDPEGSLAPAFLFLRAYLLQSSPVQSVSRPSGRSTGRGPRDDPPRHAPIARFQVLLRRYSNYTYIHRDLLRGSLSFASPALRIFRLSVGRQCQELVAWHCGIACAVEGHAYDCTRCKGGACHVTGLTQRIGVGVCGPAHQQLYRRSPF